jgi:hypothetical protein
MVIPVHHPVFWFLVLMGVLGYLFYRNHQTENDIQRLCELLGTHAVLYRSAQTTQDSVTTICAHHQQNVFL